MSKLEKLYAKSRRENPIQPPEAPSSSSSSPASAASPDLSRLIFFQKEFNGAADFPARYTVLRRWWPAFCVGSMPEVHQQLLSVRIGYEIVAKTYAEAGMLLSPTLEKNLLALRDFDIEGMSANMKVMMRILTQTGTSERGDEMAKKAAVKKEAVLGVSQFYLEVFEGQAKAKLTDAQIAAAIKAKTGGEPTLKSVASYRCMYNAGRIHGQSKCPAEKCKAVRVSRAKAKKPMSEETKAKLKAYTAAKKAKAAKKTAKKK